MSDLVIETTELRKTYGPKVAVADLTLEVPRGEVFGFLGPNGAGKSTSVKMLLGLVAPTSGSARVLGLPPGHEEAMRRIGFLPEHFRFHEWLQASELLDLHARLYGIDKHERRRRIPELLELVGLAAHAKRPLSGFSKGMLQRIGLAQALLNRPELVFLDEPTSALDPFGRMLVRSIISNLKDQGTTVFLNSHLLGEVEATCDRVSFIKQGRVLQTIGIHDFGLNQLLVELRIDAVTPALLAALDQVVEEYRVIKHNHAGTMDRAAQGEDELTTTAVATVTMTTLELRLSDEEALPLVAERVVASGAQLYALTPRRASLEQVFLEIVGAEDSGQ